VLKERIVFLVCFWSLLTFIRSRFQAKPATLLISNKFPSRLYCLCAFPLINVEIALCKSSLFFCPFYLIITYNELNKVARGWPFQIKGLVITEGTVVMHHTVWWCVCVCGGGGVGVLPHLQITYGVQHTPHSGSASPQCGTATVWCLQHKCAEQHVHPHSVMQPIQSVHEYAERWRGATHISTQYGISPQL